MSAAMGPVAAVILAAILAGLGFVIKLLLNVSTDVAVLKDGIKPLDTLEVRVTHLEKDVAVLQAAAVNKRGN